MQKSRRNVEKKQQRIKESWKQPIKEESLTQAHSFPSTEKPAVLSWLVTEMKKTCPCKEEMIENLKISEFKISEKVWQAVDVQARILT